MTGPWDNDPMTPTRATRKTWGWVPFGLNAIAASAVLTIVGIFTVAGIVFAVMPATTAVQEKGAQNSAKVNSARFSATVASMAYQEPLVAEMQQHLTNITGPGGLASTRSSLPPGSPEQATVRAQELNEVGSFCSESANLDPGVAPGSQQLEVIVGQNCIAGTPLAEPQLADPVPAGRQ